ncbi:MAG: ribosomal RNA small subunit methyltransferase I [Deltaproteobacteria bacterium]|jgi:16S rRNA (cytidine1402-2'-O)-methyltransferase|nr:MAG: ribosomal RNA small subunit methyltransferase I [Deltaproteobacteria bacterium]
MKGKLYIVATPIGNLEDITLRALKTLKEVDIIACEDTRVTRKLLSKYDIEKPLVSYHEYNEQQKARELISLLESGKNIALVSDSGTPGISDPGYRIVTLASQKGIEVIPVPGPCAAIAALSVSGLPTTRFAFFGFLPKSPKRRKEFLESIREYPETLVFYESPNRILETLKDIIEILGDRNVSISRELTKVFEESLKGKASSVLETLSQRQSIKGEITVVVEGKRYEETELGQEIERELKELREKGLSLKEAVKTVSKEPGISKNLVYKKALTIWQKQT